MKGQTNSIGKISPILVINVSTDNNQSVNGLVVTVTRKVEAIPDYDAIDEYGVAIMDTKGKFYQTDTAWQAAGSPTPNGIAVSDGTHRFCIAKDIINRVCNTDGELDREYWGAYNTEVSGVTTTTDKTTAMQDFNGVANTDAIVKNVTSSDGWFTKAPWSAAGLCRQFTFPNGTKGYLGACGEWKIVKDSISTVNTLMTAISGAYIETTVYPNYWSSTQYSNTYAWYWYFNYANCDKTYKYPNARVRAFSEIKSFTTGESKEYIVENGMVSIPVEKDTEYTISVNDKEGYITPQSVTYNTSTGTRHITLQYIYNPVIDLSKQDIYGNPIALTTANCYVVSKPGKYKFPLKYGAAFKNGEENPEAYTNNGGTYSSNFVRYDGTDIMSSNIEVYRGTWDLVFLSIADTDGIFTNLSFVDGDLCRYVLFEVTSVPDTGANGIISIGRTTQCVWSWHIWVWPYDLTPVEITNATGITYNILPVNLATKLDTADSINTTTGWKNWFYQFGRPTPLLCPATYNSTTNHTSYGALSFQVSDTAERIEDGITNPTTFYKYDSSYNYNWFQTNSNKTYNLWDAACTSTGNSDNNVVKTVYDPCPIGFKMPNGNTFTGFSVISSANSIVKFTRYSGDSTGVGFPMSGCRNGSGGSLYGVGSYGSVWLSSARSQYYAYYLNFGSSNVYPQIYNYRAYGFSVRPVADDSTIQPAVITFSFRNKTYKAELGMTWNDWVNSSYYDNTLYISGNRIIDGSYCLLDNGNAEVTPSQTILPISYGYGLY